MIPPEFKDCSFFAGTIEIFAECILRPTITIRTSWWWSLGIYNFKLASPKEVQSPSSEAPFFELPESSPQEVHDPIF
jgi:hypothetical protein